MASVTISLSEAQKEKVLALYKKRKGYAGLSDMCREILLEAVDTINENIALEAQAPRHP